MFCCFTKTSFSSNLVCRERKSNMESVSLFYPYPSATKDWSYPAKLSMASRMLSSNRISNVSVNTVHV